MAMTCEKVRELASGFVLGALETEDMIAVQDHLDSCDLHAEIDELGGVVPYLAQAVPTAEPPAWLRESVIAAAKADARGRQRVGKGTEHRLAGHAASAPAASAPAAAVPAAAETAPAAVISFRSRTWARRRQIAAWSTRIAAALLVVGLGTYAVSVQPELNKPVPTDSVQHYITQGTRLVPLTASNSNAKTSGIAALQQTGHVFLDVSGLSATTGDQVYVLWVTDAAGRSSEVGWFTADSTGRVQLEFPNVPNSPNLFLYVTLEPNSHVTKATGPIIVSGTFSS